MSENNRARVLLRMDSVLCDKIRAISKAENRTMTMQIEYFLMKAVESYEATHGEVTPMKSTRLDS